MERRTNNEMVIQRNEADHLSIKVIATNMMIKVFPI